MKTNYFGAFAVVSSVAVISALASAAQAKNPEIAPAPLGTCDGTKWSGLMLGKTSARDIKSQFKTGRSDLPMSLELAQPRGTAQKIFVLFSDKHDESPVAALLLRYSNDGPDLADLRRAVGVPEQDYYQTGRLENWKIATFPSKGIVAFELTASDRQTVPVIMLCSPGSIAAACRGLSRTVQPVVERLDPHANEPREMTFGIASVSTDLKGLELKDGEKQRLERTMIDTTAGGTMRYAYGARGSYITTVTGSFTRDKGGSLSVTSTISGYGPYGLVTSTGSAYKSLPAQKTLADLYSDANSNNYTVALYEALEKSSAAFRSAMLASGSPPIETLRLQKWQQLQERLRSSLPATFAAAPAPVAPPVVPVPHSAPATVPAPVQSLFTFANGAQTVGNLISFDGSTYTVSTPKGMRQFKAAAIKSITALVSNQAALPTAPR